MLDIKGSIDGLLDSSLTLNPKRQVLDIKGRIDGALNLAKSVFGLKGFVSGDSNRDDSEDAAVAVKR